MMPSESQPQSQSRLLLLPAELRLEFYAYLLPHLVPHTAYIGLRQSCSVLRLEYDHEALTHITPHSYTFTHDDDESKTDIHTEPTPTTMSCINVIEFTYPAWAESLDLGGVPWSGMPWVEYVTITIPFEKYWSEIDETFYGFSDEVAAGISLFGKTTSVKRVLVRQLTPFHAWESDDRPCDARLAGSGWEWVDRRIMFGPRTEDGGLELWSEWNKMKETKQVGGWWRWIGGWRGLAGLFG